MFNGHCDFVLANNYFFDRDSIAAGGFFAIADQDVTLALEDFFRGVMGHFVGVGPLPQILWVGPGHPINLHFSCGGTGSGGAGSQE